jgi:hypothetical protein
MQCLISQTHLGLTAFFSAIKSRVSPIIDCSVRNLYLFGTEKYMSCFDSKSITFIEFENRTVCLLSSYEYMSTSWTTCQTVRMAKCSARCLLAPSMFHHATFSSPILSFSSPFSCFKTFLLFHDADQ